MKIKYNGINKLDEQAKIQVKRLSEELAKKIEATNAPEHADQEMKVQLKEVPAHRHIATGKTELQMKLFFKYGPFFLHNKPAVAALEGKGFKAFTHGYVKYFRQV